MTLQPFLELYQNDFPMIPYMSDDIINIVKTLMKLFIKADVVDSCSYKDLRKIHWSSKDNFISSYSINVGCATRNRILESRKKDIVSSQEISSFQKESRMFIISLVEKWFEKMLNGILILRFVRKVINFWPFIQIKDVNHKYFSLKNLWNKFYGRFFFLKF